MSNAKAQAVLRRGWRRKLKTTAAALSDLITLCGTPAPRSRRCAGTARRSSRSRWPSDVSSDVALSILEDAEELPGRDGRPRADARVPGAVQGQRRARAGLHRTGQRRRADASKGQPGPALPARPGRPGRARGAVRRLPARRQRGEDALGRPAGNVTGTVGEIAPKAGDNVVTNIDARVQAVLEQQLAAADPASPQPRPTPRRPGHYKADSAAGVVMDVRNGHIIAMASLPTYDPSIWVGGITDEGVPALTAKARGRRWCSRCLPGRVRARVDVQGGLVVGDAAERLHLGRARTTARPTCRSGAQVHQLREHGLRRIAQRAIEVSCDTVFYEVAFEQWHQRRRR